MLLRNNSLTITPASWGILPVSHKNASAVMKLVCLFLYWLPTLLTKKSILTGNSPRIWIGCQKLMLPLLKHTGPVVKAAM